MVHKVTVIICLCLSVFAKAQDSVLCIRSGLETTCLRITSQEDQDFQLNETLTKIRGTGYFSADLSKITTKSDTIFADINPGIQYQYLHVKKHNVSAPENWNESERFLSISEFKRWQTRLLKYYENNGYPFTKIILSSFDVKGDTIGANLLVDKYVPITYDSIQIDGSSSLSTAYLSKYLNIEEGEAYREADIKQLDKRLRNLSLVKLTNASRVVFYQQKARVILSIDKAVTDRVDGIIGFAPNSANSDDNSLLITGEVNIELNNLFQSAKQLEVHWRNYLQNSQMLNVGATWPYLAGTNLGLAGNFDLNKYDTQFVNLRSKLAFRYQQQANNYLQVYYERISSNLLSVDTNLVRSSKKIPTNNPFQIDNYGVAVYNRSYDYLPNPRRGFELLADASLGSKTILRNSEVDQVLFYDSTASGFISIYDTLNKKSLRANLSFNTAWFIPIKKNSTIVQRLAFNGVFAKQIFFNELYNFGGFSSLRGFDENEIFASKALRYTLEYRYLIGENSNVGLFVNVAAIENTLVSQDLLFDTPYGFGALANIQVRGGILNLAYALGSRQQNPIQLSTAKFHFGIINYF